MRRSLRLTGSVFVALAVAGCGDETTQAKGRAEAPSTIEAGVEQAGAGVTSAGVAGKVPARWYEPARVERGGATYAQHCAACHGNSAQGDANWRKQGANGRFPPPPLDGSGHAWHHPLSALGSQIKHGAPGGGGSMPRFAAALSDEQILDVIAWFQSHWPDEIYAAWSKAEERARQAGQ